MNTPSVPTAPPTSGALPALRLADRPALAAIAVLAASAPSLLAYNVSPSPTFFNQALAIALWGWFVVAVAQGAGGVQVRAAPWNDIWRGPAALLAALALLLGAAVWSGTVGALPGSLTLSAVGLLAAAAVLVAGGVAARGRGDAATVFALFCLGWAVAGVFNAGIAIVQVFTPAWPDGDWIARSGIPGRAVGNLRQPNHLSSLLLWSAIAVVGLVELRRLSRRWGAALFALVVLAIVLTASRTGLVGVLLLALWALADRRLSRPTRALLLAAPLLYLLAWFGLAAWAEVGRHTFGGEQRLAEADLSSSRFGIWANTLALIRQQPWSGVGFGEFNFAWTLTPFPGRPIAFFDHTHNLVLQLAVELGLPLAAAVLGLLSLALWQAWRGVAPAAAFDADIGTAQRCALLMVSTIALHSQLEYPLWYAYFLLPAAWAWGFALGRDAPAAAVAADAGAAPRFAPAAGSVWRRRALAGAGLLLVAGSVLSVFDYLRVVSIFAPGDGAAPLAQRIEAGRHSLFFAHHAEYAAATAFSKDSPDDDIPAGEPPAATKGAFASAPHYLLDTRLTMAWARALAAQGDTERARYVAQRLKEFRNADADGFFAPCADAAVADKPFQCQAPTKALTWRDFRR